MLKKETRKPYYRALDVFLEKELADGQTILPARKDIFNALAATSYDQVRVLLVGQDPYPTPGHAHGLCFSVQPTVRSLPFSLRNIFRELHEDVGCQIPNNGYLEPWADRAYSCSIRFLRSGRTRPIRIKGAAGSDSPIA